MVLIKDNAFRRALINHRKEITELNKKIDELSNKPKTEEKTEIPIGNSLNSEQELRIKLLENELKSINNKYTDLLEKLLETIGNRKSEISNRVSNTKEEQPQKNTENREKPKKTQKTPNLSINSYQILLLLQESRAKSPEFAVSSNQLKTAFNINRTEKTLRNKLLSLSKEGLISVLGEKPKRFFLTQAGINLISQEQNTALQIK